jgi:hypothetical protein
MNINTNAGQSPSLIVIFYHQSYQQMLKRKTEKDLEENDRRGWNGRRDLERGQGSSCKKSLVALLCTGPMLQNAIT